jgi:hypothetical protein
MGVLQEQRQFLRKVLTLICQHFSHFQGSKTGQKVRY